MRNNIITTFALCSLLFALFTAGNVRAKVIEERVTVMPGRIMSSSEEQDISSAALKVLRHIAEARADIHEQDTNRAVAELRLSESLIDTIKAALPTVKVKDLVWVAIKHLSYEDTMTVKQDLPPIYAALDEIRDLVPAEKVREHLNRAKEQLEQGNKEGAKKEFVLADESLLYSEIDLPLAYTERHISTALVLLAKNDALRAEASLKKAEDGVKFISVNIYSPVSQARRSLWQAAKDYVSGDLAAAKRDLKEARVLLESAVKSGAVKERAEAEKIMKDIETIQREVDKGAEETGREISDLYNRVKDLTLETVDIFQAGGNEEGEDIEKATQNLNISK